MTLGDEETPVRAKNAEWIEQADPLDSVVTVKEASDFPDPVGGVRTLDTDTSYRINGQIDIGTDQLEYSSGSSILAENISHDLLTYTGTNAMILATDVDVTLGAIQLSAPNGEIFNCNSTVQDSLFGTEVVRIIDAAGLGTVADYSDILITDLIVRNIDDGFVITGTPGTVALSRHSCTDMSDGGRYLFFDSNFAGAIAVLDTINLRTFGANTVGFEVDPAATFSQRSRAVDCFFSPSVTDALVGFDQTTKGWQFTGNDPIPDSSITAEMFFNGNADDTSIPAVNTWVEVENGSAVTTTGDNLERFTHTSPNTLTYDSQADEKIQIVADVTVFSGSNNQTIAVSISLNGNILTSSITSASAQQSGLRLPITANAFEQLTDGDEIDVRIRNETSDANVTVESMTVTAVKA